MGATNRPVLATGSKKICIFCKNPHSPSACDVIKDLKKRTDKKLCFNCLGHLKVSSCNSKRRCHICKRKHHTSLCSNEQQPTGRSSQSTNTGQPTTSTAMSHPNPLQSASQQLNSNPPLTRPVNSITTDTASLFITSPPSHTTKNSVCLLKTAIATVTHGRKSATANLLFDKGSQ